MTLLLPARQRLSLPPWNGQRMTKFAVGMYIHYKVKVRFRWIDFNWYAPHRADTGMHFCYHFSFHYKQLTIMKKTKC